MMILDSGLLFGPPCISHPVAGDFHSTMRYEPCKTTPVNAFFAGELYEEPSAKMRRTESHYALVRILHVNRITLARHMF